MDSPPPIGRAFLPGEVGTDNTQCPGMGAECVGSCDSRSNRTVGERLMAVIGKIISGGQTGADRGALDLFLPAPSARSSFYKVFALEELPAKE